MPTAMKNVQQMEDLKEHSARRKEERAARVKDGVERADSRQLGILGLWRARERLGGVTELTDTAGVKGGAAKGKL